MAANQTTIDFFLGKALAPSELRTAEWSAVPREIRERAFFMAAVEDAEILDQFRGKVEAIVRGEKSESEAAAELNDYLIARGYQPEPGTEGTIKDLRSLRRMRVALQTNVQAARSYGQWARQQGTLAAFPATRYSRGREADVPRDWPARWNAARAATTEVGCTLATGEDDMVALANHPIWTHPEFNEMGSPWTPFAFGSGMMTTPVSRKTAQALGLLDDAPAEMIAPQERSFNETLAATPDVAAQDLRTALAERLQGFALWDRGQGSRVTGEEEDNEAVPRRLIFTDPNGTRPGTVEEIAETIAAPLPVDPITGERFPQLQAEALELFATDPEAFGLRTNRDRWADFGRLVGRVLPNEAERRAFLSRVAEEARRKGTPGWLSRLGRVVGGALDDLFGDPADLPTRATTYAAMLRTILNYLR
jgi:hypothetical protein